MRGEFAKGQWIADAPQPDSRPMFRRILIAAGLLLLVVIGAFAAVIAFNAPTAPPVLAAGNSIPGIAQWNFAELPKPQTLKARDGAPLNYRLYPGRPDRAVVLVHGSSRHGRLDAQARPGAAGGRRHVYAISLRGHGGSGTANGDVSYIGQLDDDLADLVKGLGLDKPGIRRTLVGFSSGGGFVLRIAGGKQAGLFNDYFAISPYIGQDSPTNKPNAGGWADVAVPRIIALSLLDERRPAVVPGPARRPLRHRRQGRATAARRSTPSGWRRACSSAATGAESFRAYRRPPRSWSAPTTSCSTPISSSRCCNPSIRASA